MAEPGLLLGTLALLALSLPIGASADSSGGATPVPPPAATPKPVRPTLIDVRCLSNPAGGCVEEHRVTTGGSITVRGRNLAAASSLVFYGRRGRRDDLTVPVSATDPTFANANVPANARSGPVGVLTQSGPRSTRWSGLVIENPAKELHPYKQAAVPAAQVEATLSKPRRISVGGMHKSVFSYEIEGQQPVSVQVNLVRQSDGSVVRSWNQGNVAPGALQRIVWDGNGAGKPLPEGRYFFQVVTPGSSPAATAQTAASNGESVALMNHVFPVRGSYDFGGSQTGFGAPRSGHSHAGQDILSPCGTPIVAARGGKVIYSGYGGAAGNYVATHGLDGDNDFAYMHMREPALVETGDRVYTGQLLGYVGSTGSSTACHLHFEMWTQPGWYKGGRAVDPLPSLKRWLRAEKRKN